MILVSQDLNELILALGVHNGVLRVHTVNNNAYYSLNQ